MIEDEPQPLLPINNPHLFGHAEGEAEFLSAWNSGRMAHAWLMTGPRGIGKATLAYRIARFVLSGGGEPDMFGDGPTSLALPEDHQIIHRIAAGGHGDLKIVQRGFTDEKKGKLRSEIVVADVRDVGHFLSMTPAEGGWRVIIVDAADEMNRNAANAILKVLEEPPSRALLLLVSHAPGRLLPTIRSRCRQMTLKPLSDDIASNLLSQHRPDMSEADKTALLRLSEGSIGRALELEEQGGLEFYRQMVGLLGSLPNLDIPSLHGFAESVGKGADSFRTSGDLLTWWLARLIRARGRGEPLSEIVGGEGAIGARLATVGSLDQWVEVWEKMVQSFARTEAINLDRKQVMLTAFSTLGRLSST